MPSSKNEVKNIVDEHLNERKFHSKFDELHQKIEEIHSKHRPVFEHLEELKSKVSRIDEAKKDTRQAFKQRILRKISRNSKEYISNVILSLIKKYGRINGLQLREIVVHEQGLCSKSSFYRLLAEIEQIEEIGIIQEGKEKIYLLNVQNPNETN